MTDENVTLNSSHGKTANSRVVRLEMLRGFAAIYVMVYHILNPWTKTWGWKAFPLRMAPEAVIFFFLLSGFVISLAMERRPQPFPKYLLHRFVRIYPVYGIALILGVVDICLIQSQPLNLRNLLGNMMMFQDVGLKPGTWFAPFAGNLPLWSLAYEWWFYMLFFPIWKYVPSSRRKWVALGVSGFGLATFLCHPNQISLYLFFFILWWMGAEFGHEYHRFGTVTLRRQTANLWSVGILTVVSMTAFFLSHVPRSHGIGEYPLLFGRQFAAALAFSAGAFIWQRARWRGFDRIFGAFLWFAPLSYGIYLFHYPICISGGYLTWLHPIAVRLIASVGCVILLSWVVERFIQPTVVRWSRTRRRRGQSLKAIVLQRAKIQTIDPQ